MDETNNNKRFLTGVRLSLRWLVGRLQQLCGHALSGIPNGACVSRAVVDVQMNLFNNKLD